MTPGRKALKEAQDESEKAQATIKRAQRDARKAVKMEQRAAAQDKRNSEDGTAPVHEVIRFNNWV